VAKLEAKMAFKKAERKYTKIKGAFAGIAGSGKTKSALRMATGMGGKIALIDTENSSASLYADAFSFDTDTITPPYTPEKYIAAIKEAVRDGFNILIIDSLSHAWAGEGGILRKKEQLDIKGGNSFTNWAKMTPQHELLISTILNSDIHIFCTMRSKQAYVMEESANKKMIPKKAGLAPIQREGIEYEFTFVLDIGSDHLSTQTKDRTELMGDEAFLVTESTGERLMEWLSTAKQPTEQEVKEKREKPLKDAKLKEILSLAKVLTKGMNPAQKKTWSLSYLSTDRFQSLETLELAKLDAIIQMLNGQALIAERSTENLTTDDVPF
jgi:hypothetical protein